MGLAKNNGATPWHAELSIGKTPTDQLFKLINFTLTARQYFQQFPDSLHLAFHPLYPTKNSSTTNMLLAGSIFLDHYFTVFDYTTSPARVGVAKKN